MAWALPENVLKRFQHDDPYKLLERQGKVVARLDQRGSFAIALREYLAKRGIELEPRAKIANIRDAVSAEHEVALLILTNDTRRRLARKLGAIRPRAGELNRFYVRFTEEKDPDAGKAMVAWLAVHRVALAAARPGIVVVMIQDSE